MPTEWTEPTNMTSNTKSQLTEPTLESFKHATDPTSIDDIDQYTPSEVIDIFGEIESYRVAVQINGRDPLLVGGQTDEGTQSYRLYHWPQYSGTSAYAGTITHDRTLRFDGPDEHKLVFNPAGDAPDAETVVHPVESLEVIPHDRTERLDQALPYIRTEITDSDWTTGERTDTSYGKWIQAVNRLANYAAKLHDPQYEPFPIQTIMENQIMHAVARYELNAEDLLSQTASCVSRRQENGVYDASPEAFRSILLSFAESIEAES